VSKRRKKSKKNRSNNKALSKLAEPSEVQKTTEQSAPASVQRYPEYVYVIVFLFCLIIYLLYFYSVKLGETQDNEAFSRLSIQRLLFASPGAFFSAWTGGDTTRCSVVDRIPILTGVVAILAAAFVVGRIGLYLIRVDRSLNQLEVLVFAEGVGLSFLSLFTLAIGLVGGLHRLLLFIVPIGAATFLFVFLWRSGKFAIADRETEPILNVEANGPRDWITAKALWFGLPFALFIVLGAMLPPREFDVREYHLQIPKEWYQAGQISLAQHNIYGNMPLGAEMQAVLGMVVMQGERDWWTGALVGKTVMSLFTLLASMTLFLAGRRFVNTTAGVIAALVYVSTPWIARTSMMGYNEPAVAFYFIAAIYSVFLWKQLATRNISHVLLAGFMAGSAVACKYPALVFVVVPLFFWILIERRLSALANDSSAVDESCNNESASTTPNRAGYVHWKEALVFAAAALVACGLWFGKNAYLADNPTYPLLYEWFGGESLDTEQYDRWTTVHGVPKTKDGSYSLVQMKDAITRVTLRSDWLSPLLMPLAALSLFVRRFRSLVWPLVAIYVFVILSWWLLTHRIDRFWVLVLPVVALLAGIGVTWSSTRMWHQVVIGMMVWGLVCNLQIITSHIAVDNRFFVALEELRLGNIRDGVFDPTFNDRAHKKLNEVVPAGCKVLLVGDAEPFDLEVPVLYNTCFDDCVFTSLMKGKTKQERIDALESEKIAFIFVDWNSLARYRSPGNYGYSSDFVHPDVFKELVNERVLGRPTPSFNGEPRGQIFPVLSVLAKR